MLSMCRCHAFEAVERSVCFVGEKGAYASGDGGYQFSSFE